MTAWSGLYDDQFTDGPYGSSPYVNRPSLRKQLGKKLKRQGNLKDKGLMVTSFASLEGVTKTAQSYYKVEAVNDALPSDREQGGVRAITTVSVHTAIAATAAEEDEMEAITNYDSQPSTYPTDASGNGGGGKLGF